ncbi:MAG TPA: GTPase domain-containing protein [Candidatus Limnocylindrales bacterium]|nr:GTPase domain-containing protein [Candidatus Limnocylindrales bacterium]
MLTDALGDLASALQRRTAAAPGPTRRARAERLRRHVVDHLLPRARDASAPLIVVILGSTGSGKSSLFNGLAGRALSPSGVLRPTTRRPLAVVHPDDAAADLLPGMVARGALELSSDPGARRGLVLVDAPDFDSVELANRELAVELLEAADLVIFVSTATRYADQVPWSILGRARQRGVPLLAVLNRLPPEAGDAAAIAADYRHLLERGNLEEAGAFGRLEVVPVSEGELDAERDALAARAIAPIRDALDRLTRDEVARRDLARRSLAAALEGLPAAVEEVAREVDEERDAVAVLLDVAERAYGDRRRALGDELGRGTFMRAEVLRQWQEFVGAGQVARILAQGIGRVVAGVRSLFNPGPPAPAIEVREAAFADLVALAVQHADAAARRTATTWVDDRYGAAALAEAAALWGVSPKLGARLTADLEAWAAGVGEEIRSLGEQRKGWAQVASIGVNAVGTSAVLAVFVHTGGLTGAEVGITAATAVVNQKLLEAIFGEANVAAFVSRARESLGSILDAAFADERGRYSSALGGLASDDDLGAILRDAARRSSAMDPA